MNRLETAAVNMGVYLCGGNIGMTQHHLDGAEIGAMFQEVGGKGVAQGVRADLFVYS